MFVLCIYLVIKFRNIVVFSQAITTLSMYMVHFLHSFLCKIFVAPSVLNAPIGRVVKLQLQVHSSGNTGETFMAGMSQPC